MDSNQISMLTPPPIPGISSAFFYKLFEAFNDVLIDPTPILLITTLIPTRVTMTSLPASISSRYVHQHGSLLNSTSAPEPRTTTDADVKKLLLWLDQINNREMLHPMAHGRLSGGYNSGNPSPSVLYVCGLLVVMVIITLCVYIIRIRGRMTQSKDAVKGQLHDGVRPDWTMIPPHKNVRSDRWQWDASNMGGHMTAVSAHGILMSSYTEVLYEGAISTVGYQSGRHVFTFMWPRDQKIVIGAHICIGIGYGDFSLSSGLSHPVVGGTKQSMGFSLVDNCLVYNDVLIGVYPRNKPRDFCAPTLINMYVDIDEGKLYFGVEDDFWGLAFDFSELRNTTGLEPELEFYPMIGARAASGKLMMFYKGNVPVEAIPVHIEDIDVTLEQHPHEYKNPAYQEDECNQQTKDETEAEKTTDRTVPAVRADGEAPIVPAVSADVAAPTEGKVPAENTSTLTDGVTCTGNSRCAVKVSHVSVNDGLDNQDPGTNSGHTAPPTDVTADVPSSEQENVQPDDVLKTTKSELIDVNQSARIVAFENADGADGFTKLDQNAAIRLEADPQKQPPKTSSCSPMSVIQTTESHVEVPLPQNCEDSSKTSHGDSKVESRDHQETCKTAQAICHQWKPDINTREMVVLTKLSTIDAEMGTDVPDCTEVRSEQL